MITHLVQAVQSDGVGEEVGDGATGSGTAMGSGMMMGTLPAASRLKAGSPKDGVGDGDSDGAVLREVADAPREAASMARCRGRQRRRRGRRRCRGRENWAA
jgi:hypothetical protein